MQLQPVLNMMAAGGPLLGGGGAQALFSWQPGNAQELQANAIYTGPDETNLITTTDGTTLWFQDIEAGELPFSRLERTENILFNSTQLDAGGWTDIGAVTQVGNTYSDLDSGEGFQQAVPFAFGPDLANLLGRTVWFVIKLSGDGNTQILVSDDVGGDNVAQDISLTGTPQIFAVRTTFTTTVRTTVIGRVRNQAPVPVATTITVEWAILAEGQSEGGNPPTSAIDSEVIYNALVPGVEFKNSANDNTIDGSGLVTEIPGSTITDGGFTPYPDAVQRSRSSSIDGFNFTGQNVTLLDLNFREIGLPTVRMTANAGAAVHQVFTQIQYTKAGVNCAYVIAKAGTSPRIAMRNDSDGLTTNMAWTVFNLVNGTFDSNASVIDSGMEFNGDETYLCWQVFNVTGVGNEFMIVALSDSDTAPSDTTRDLIFNPVGTEQIDVSHVQVEETGYFTTPIISDNATAARSLDTLNTNARIDDEFEFNIDVTLPPIIPSGETIPLIGSAVSDVDIVRVDDGFNVVMDDGGTPEILGTASAKARITVDYARTLTERTGTFNAGVPVIGDAPSDDRSHEDLLLGGTSSVRRARSRFHNVTIKGNPFQNVVVFLNAGQSNTLLGATIDPSDQITTDGILQLGSIGASNFNTILAADALEHPDYQPTDIGFAYTFAKVYKTANPSRTVFLVPAGKSGAGFSNNEWNPGDPSYDYAVERMTFVMNKYPQATFAAVLWHQGETDALAAVSESIYANNLDAMMAAILSTIPRATGKPFVLGEMDQNWVSNDVNRQPVQDAIIDTPNRVPNSIVVSSAGLTTYDGIHFDAASQRTLGQRYYDAFSLI